MSNQPFERYYVLEQFREFYAVVLRYKQEIEAPLGKGPPPPPPNDDAPADDIADLEPDEDGETQANVIRSELSALVQRQAQGVLRRGDEREQKRFREVQYVMAAMADEVFLNLSWLGKDYWEGNLLEDEFFHTHDAGSRFFVNLEEILRHRDPTKAEVAAVYLLALSLGFRGQHQDIEGQARLEHFRLQLFASLFQRNPGLSDDAQLFSQSYAHTLAGKPVQWLPLLRPWLAAIGAVALIYVAISHAIWVHESDKVTRIVDRIHDRSGQGSNPPADDDVVGVEPPPQGERGKPR